MSNVTHFWRKDVPSAGARELVLMFQLVVSQMTQTAQAQSSVVSLQSSVFSYQRSF
jgi:hypothetical protein